MIKLPTKNFRQTKPGSVYFKMEHDLFSMDKVFLLAKEKKS